MPSDCLIHLRSGLEQEFRCETIGLDDLRFQGRGRNESGDIESQTHDVLVFDQIHERATVYRPLV